MKLSNIVISNISVRTKNRLALELDCSVQTIERWIKLNDENNDLTKTKAVQILSEETGLDQSEILEDTIKEVQS